METKDFKSLLESMKNSMIANQKKITDFNQGSVILTLFEAIANVLEQAYIDTRLGFQTNLKSIATSIFGFKRKTGKVATTSVIFERAVALDNSVIIPAGTKVSDGSHIFFTTTVGTIPENETKSNPVYVQAEKIGVEYNIEAKAINTIDSIVSSEIVSVSNPSKAIGGADEESETEMIARFKTYINGLQGSNLYGLKAGVLALEEVRSVGVVEHYPPLDDFVNVTIYVDDGTGNMTETLRQKIFDLVNGDGTSNMPGLKAAGINVAIEPCTQVPIDIEADITTYRIEKSLAEAELKDALESTVNSLSVDEDVIYADIITSLKRAGSYVTNVKNLKINAQADDVLISVNQIARLGNVTLRIGSES